MISQEFANYSEVLIVFSKIYELNTIDSNGAVAQLGEHLVRNEKVGGSSPLCSNKFA